MATPEEQLQAAADLATQAANRADGASEQIYEFANGDENTQVVTDNGLVDTIAKLAADFRAEIVGQTLKATIEEQTLSAGQTTVSTTEITMPPRPLLFVEGSFEQDFEVTGSNTIELGQSFPAGTTIWLLQNVPTEVDDLQTLVDQAQAFADEAEGYRDEAVDLVDQASAAANIFESTTEGLANTQPTGEVDRYFSVVSADGEQFLDLYKNESGTAEFVDSYPNSSAVSRLVEGATYTFDSVASMKADTRLRVGDRVRTLGYYEPGDGGSNSYEVVVTGTGTDDGGSFIDLPATGLQADGLFLSGRVRLAQFGHTGQADEKGIFTAAYSTANQLSLPFDCSGDNVLTSGGHYWPDGLVVYAEGCVVRRATTGYTGSEPLVTVGAGVRVHGHITFDGNNPDESGVFEDGYMSVRVVGDGVTFDYITCLNTPMTSGGAKQLNGCTVEGDNFYCKRFTGRRCGYTALRLYIGKDMQRFTVDSIEVYDSDFKGVSIGNLEFRTIRDVEIGSLYVDYDPTQDASDGFLCDLMNDNRFLGVGTLTIDRVRIRGGRSNCFKIENVDTLNMGYVELDVTTTYSAGNAATIETNTCNIETLVFNSRSLRVRSLNTSIANVVAHHSGDAGGVPNLVRYEGLSLTGPNFSIVGPRKHYIGELKILNAPNLTVLAGLNVRTGDDQAIHIGAVLGASAPVFGDYDSAQGGPNHRMDGALSVGRIIGTTDKTHINAEVETWVQVGQRLFQTRTNAPPTGVWRKGDYVRNVDPGVVDPGGANYINKGWICVTGGGVGDFQFEVDRLFL